MSYRNHLLFVPFIIFLVMRVWRDLRWHRASREERMGVVSVGVVVATALSYGLLEDWRGGTWLLAFSAAGGWYARELAGGMLSLLRKSLRHYFGKLGDSLAPALLPLVLLVGLAIYSQYNYSHALVLAKALILTMVLLVIAGAASGPAKKKKK